MVKISNFKETVFKKEEVTNFFKENDYLFPDPFSDHVDISVYVDKLVKNGEIIIAYDKNICGMACAYMNDEKSFTAHFQILLVNNTVQNSGIGRMLTIAIMDYARIRGMKQIELTVDKNNNKAIHVYKSLGFKYSVKVHSNINKAYMVASLEE